MALNRSATRSLNRSEINTPKGILEQNLTQSIDVPPERAGTALLNRFQRTIDLRLEPSHLSNERKKKKIDPLEELGERPAPQDLVVVDPTERTAPNVKEFEVTDRTQGCLE